MKLFIVSEQESKLRLDVFLARQIKGLSRRRAGALCSRGQICVNGCIKRGGFILLAGQEVELKGQVLEQARARAELAQSIADSFDLQVLYEDTVLCVLHKPRKMHTYSVEGRSLLG